MINTDILSNTRRAFILFEIFPSEINNLLNFISEVARRIEEEKPSGSWNNPILSYGQWMYIIRGVAATISGKRYMLVNSPKYFSEDLFSGLDAIFTNHCIQMYIEEKRFEHSKFPVIWEHLFDFNDF